MQHSRRRPSLLLAGVLAAGAILAGLAVGQPQASAAPAGRPAAPGQAVHVLASGTRSPHMIYPSGYVRERVAGPDGASAIESIPIFHVTSAGVLNGIHACRALNNDTINQGVMCADLFAEPDGSNIGVEVAPFVEGMCQNLANPSFFPECAQITMTFSVNTPLFHDAGGAFEEQCARHFNDPCSTPREFFEGENFPIPGECNSQPGGKNEVWTVIKGGSAIELPGSGVFSATATDFASQHAIVCGAL
ncbi:MAG TPA: hypothetical protein VFB06_33940 [Streptosporangiaceae bacterium]|nr:hypothetical protein [Streptosporangiaceae bacterium]